MLLGCPIFADDGEEDDLSAVRGKCDGLSVLLHMQMSLLR